jgi:hypothetical protein
VANKPELVAIILSPEELDRVYAAPCTESMFVWAELRDGRYWVWNDHYEQSSFSPRPTFPLERRGTLVTAEDLAASGL